MVGGLGGAVADLRMSYLGRISSFSLRRPWKWQGPLGKSHSQLRQEVAGGILEETENSGMKDCLQQEVGQE